MNRLLTLSFVVVAAGVGGLLLSTSGESQPTAKGIVVLQPSTPGTAQSGHVNVTGTSIAGQHVGGGAGLTGLNADNIATGTLNDARIPNNIVRTGQTQTITGNKVFSGLVTFTAPAAPFQVSSSGLVTNFNADLLDGQEGAFYRNASNLSTGLLSPNYGGTGLNTSATPTGSLLFTSGVGTWSTLPAGSNGQVLKLTGGLPVWGDNTLSGSASGDLSGTYPSPTVVALRGRNVSASAPSSGNVLKWNGSAWAPQTDNDSGLTLPFDGSASTLSNLAALKVSNTAATGSTYGVWAEDASPSGAAIFGATYGVTGTAVVGVAYGSLAYGGYFIGERGLFAVGSEYGVRAFSSTGAGLWANSYEGTGAAISSDVGVGIQADAFFDDAIVATTDEAGKSGIYALNQATTGASYGVYGQSQSPVDGFGVYSAGRLGASGAKLFRIDHPLDPANKYLQHYCAEGPEPLNVYTGNVVTDAQGSAWVDLPAYFAEINRDFRYTLTVVDDSDSDSFVMAKVAKEIVANRFKIRTSVGHTKVSWRVEGIRNDLWMQRYGAAVEVEKEGIEKGKLVHPELYGQPDELRLKTVPVGKVPVKPNIARPKRPEKQ